MKNIRFELEKYGPNIALGMIGACADIVLAFNQLVNAGAVSSGAKFRKGHREVAAVLHWILGDETDKGQGFAYAVIPNIKAFVKTIVWGKLNKMEARPNGTKRVKRELNYRMSRKMAARFIRENKPKWALQKFVPKNSAGVATAEVNEARFNSPMETFSAPAEESAEVEVICG